MPHQPKSTQKSQQIIQALYDCLSQSGHEAVSIKVIAARAGLAPGVIHYYFKTKDEITIGLAEGLIQEFNLLLENKIGRVGLGPDRIEALLKFLIDYLIFDPRLNRVFYNLIQMGFERDQLQATTRRLLAAYRDAIAQVFESSGLGNGRSIALGAALVAITEGLALQWSLDPAAFDKRQVRLLLKAAIKTQMR